MAPAHLADWITGGSFVAITGELVYLRYKRTEFRFCLLLLAFIAVVCTLTFLLAGEKFFGLQIIPNIEELHTIILAIFSSTVTVWLAETIRRIRKMPSYAELEHMVQDRTTTLQSIIDCSPIAIIQARADHVVTIWNRAAEKLFGWKAEEAIGKPLPTIPHGREAEFEEKLKETLNNEQKPGFMTQRKHKDGHLIDICLWNAPLRSGANMDRLAIAMFADMSKEKQLTENLAQAKTAAERANAAKSKYLAHMSHEIRTPLSAIIGFGELLLKGDLPGEQRKKFTETIVRNGRCLGLLIDDILDMSKIEAGEMKMDSHPFSVLELLKDIKTTLELRALAKGIRLELSVSDRVPGEIFADGLRLRQIVMNLAGNAIKFTNKGGVFISADHAAECLKIVVRDSGPGMTPDQQARLFRSYGQADKGVSGKFGGTGLGLFLSKELAKLMNGHLILTDSAPGRGSTFEIQISAPIVNPLPVFGLKMESPPARLYISNTPPPEIRA